MSRPLIYSEKQRYVMTVMWLCGFSVGSIASAGANPSWGLLPMSKETVSKITAKSLKDLGYPPRGGMSVEQRQKCLNELKASPFNDGTLPDTVFKVLL